jgi:hypothetical protein
MNFELRDESGRSRSKRPGRRATVVAEPSSGAFKKSTDAISQRDTSNASGPPLAVGRTETREENLAMSIQVRNLRLGVLVAALAGALALASAGTAAAAKLVTSDTISFKGAYAGSNNQFTSQKCSLKSDGETTVFPCVVSGEATGIGGPEITGFTNWTSPDGEGLNCGYSALRQETSKPPSEIYKGVYGCIEVEETEPGSGIKVASSVFVDLKLTFNTVKHTVAGAYKVLEESTQP